MQKPHGPKGRNRRRGRARRAIASDMVRLYQIASSAAENRVTEDPEMFGRLLAWFVDRSLCWVWTVGPAIVGFSAADTRDGSIAMVFVDPIAEGKGIGRSLLARACDDLLRAGYREASLVTLEDTRADGLYQTLGWRRDGAAKAGSVRLVKYLG